MIRTYWKCPKCERIIPIDFTQEEVRRIMIDKVQLPCPICTGSQMDYHFFEDPDHVTYLVRFVWNDSGITREGTIRVAREILKKD